MAQVCVFWFGILLLAFSIDSSKGGQICKKYAFDIHQKFFRLQDPGFMIACNNKNVFNSERKFVKSQSKEARFANVLLVQDKNVSLAITQLSYISCITSETSGRTLVDFIAENDAFGTLRAILVVHNVGLKLKELAMDIKVNQQVYFASMKDGAIMEAYTVNDYSIVRKLGTVTYDIANDMEIIPTTSGQQSFVVRRSDLMGQHLRVMFQGHKLYGPVVRNYRDIAPFDNDTQMYDITELSSGMFPEYFDRVAKGLNLTYTFLQRKDRMLGSVKDGKPTGMVSSVYYGDTEMTAIAMTFNTIRREFVTFLPVIFVDYYALVIAAEIKNEETNWNTFIQPFHWDLWCVLILVSLIVGTWLHLGNFGLYFDKVSDFVQSLLTWIWIGFSANVGGKPKNPLPKNTSSNRVVLFSTLIVGTVIWIGYRASITSELAATKVVYPFNSMESFAKSDYRLVTFQLADVTADRFTKAAKGTLFAEIFENHMDLNGSFLYSSQGLDQIAFSQEKVAGYYTIQDVLKHGRYDCHVSYVWKEDKPSAKMGFSIRKNSPYYQFVSYEVTRLLTQGHMRFQAHRWKKKIPNCKPILREAKPLTVKKLFTVFLLLTLCVLAALSIFVFETVYKPEPTKDPAKIHPVPKVIKYHFEYLQMFLLTNRHNKRVFSKTLRDLNVLLTQYKE